MACALVWACMCMWINDVKQYSACLIELCSARADTNGEFSETSDVVWGLWACVFTWVNDVIQYLFV